MSANRKKLFVTISSILFVLAMIQPSHAELLSGDGIKNLIVGNRVYLKVPLGGELPLYYRRNGKVTGDGTSVGLGRYLAPKETGRWWIDGNRMCQQWPSWYKGRTLCFTVEDLGGDRIKWNRNDGKSGIARVGP